MKIACMAMIQIPDNGRRLRRGFFLGALLLALSSLSTNAAHAKIFKCVAENGEIAFSQTPCPKPKKEDKDDSGEDKLSEPKRGNNPNTNDAEGEAKKPAYANLAPQPTKPPQDEQQKQPVNEALSAQKRQGDARVAEQRAQCENNIKSQINSINMQMRGGSSSSLIESLQKKRRALEDRLRDC